MVIGILAAITIVAYNGVQNKAYDTTIQSDLRTLKVKFELFNAENGKYPGNSTEVALAASPFKATKGSYAVQGVTDHNLIYCYGTAAQSYGVAALSKSGNKYYITNDAGVTEYAIAWTDQTVICQSTISSYLTNFRGYAAEDITSGPWRTWAGGN